MINPLIGLPLAATMDLQYRLPPPQQVLMSPTIMVSLLLFIAAIIVVVFLYQRAQTKAKRQKRRDDLLLAKKLLFKRGGNDEDFERLNFVFENYTRIDPAANVMVHDNFKTRLKPILESTFDQLFAARIERFYFPPPKDTNALAKEKNLKKLVAQTKNVADVQAAAAMIDLMDATLKPGTILKVSFDGIENNYECLVMNYNMQFINVTLPSNNPHLMNSLEPGLRAEGSFETGPSLMAFNSTVLGVVGGSMPFCRLSIWKNAWEVRKRDSVRLGIMIEVDFQHISTAASANYTLAQLDKEIGAIRPGRIVDLSLGGGCVETPSSYQFNVGDFIRFTTSLVDGHPPATLLGSIVDINNLDPQQHEGMVKRLHVQFLALDDVSQRLLARAMKQLQDAATHSDWLKAQRMLAQMRQNKIPEAGMMVPQGGGVTRTPTGSLKKAGTSSIRARVTQQNATGSHPGVPGTGANRPAEGKNTNTNVQPGKSSTQSRPRSDTRD